MSHRETESHIGCLNVTYLQKYNLPSKKKEIKGKYKKWTQNQKKGPEQHLTLMVGRRHRACWIWCCPLRRVVPRSRVSLLCEWRTLRSVRTLYFFPWMYTVVRRSGVKRWSLTVAVAHRSTPVRVFSEQNHDRFPLPCSRPPSHGSERAQQSLVKLLVSW